MESFYIKLGRRVIRGGESESTLSFIYSGICIDQWMLEIGEVRYFSSETGVFSRNHDFNMLCDEHHCLLLWYLD